MSELPRQVHFPAWLCALKSAKQGEGVSKAGLFYSCCSVAYFAHKMACPASGAKVAIERHLPNDEEFQIGIYDLIEFGRKLFLAEPLPSSFRRRGVFT